MQKMEGGGRGTQSLGLLGLPKNHPKEYQHCQGFVRMQKNARSVEDKDSSSLRGFGGWGGLPSEPEVSKHQLRIAFLAREAAAGDVGRHT